MPAVFLRLQPDFRHHQTNNMLRAQRANEEVVLPFRHTVALVERDAAGRYHRVQIVYRLFHAIFLLDAVTNGFSAILYTIGDRRPAVVGTRAYAVQLIAST